LGYSAPSTQHPAPSTQHSALSTFSGLSFAVDPAGSPVPASGSLMPLTLKEEIASERRRARRTWLEMPAIGMESEFNVWLDEVEINPELYWKHPSNFIDRPLLSREKSS